MSVTVSALDSLDASEVWMGGQKVWSSDPKAAVAPLPEEPYYAKGATDVREPTPAKVIYTPESPTAAAQVTPYSLLQSPTATDLRLPPLVRAARAKAAGIPWKTVGIVAGVVAAGGLVTWMLVKTSRGFRRPAMAGLGRVRRHRSRR